MNIDPIKYNTAKKRCNRRWYLRNKERLRNEYQLKKDRQEVAATSEDESEYYEDSGVYYETSESEYESTSDESEYYEPRYRINPNIPIIAKNKIRK